MSEKNCLKKKQYSKIDNDLRWKFINKIFKSKKTIKKVNIKK